mmetsp:Transcript_30378/g.58400  ORF Transcript_30378/g.58400 Transcript_30378/m.58400 type:complete len:177 (-) Transcript_30378:308-838(-)
MQEQHMTTSTTRMTGSTAIMLNLLFEAFPVLSPASKGERIGGMKGGGLGGGLNGGEMGKKGIPGWDGGHGGEGGGFGLQGRLGGVIGGRGGASGGGYGGEGGGGEGGGGEGGGKGGGDGGGMTITPAPVMATGSDHDTPPRSSAGGYTPEESSRELFNPRTNRDSACKGNGSTVAA